ncbi:SidA/IucD/PvdA family monooxygenase [bacterium]|nr:SidA/IucD/PvdA family monooxygenase [bacterium]
MFEWLIIGGGIHGTYLGNLLTGRSNVPLDRLAILDPLDAPCQRWKDLTSRTGMTHLRSPVVHHLDFQPSDLENFLRRQKKKAYNSQGGTYRPSLKDFNAHIDHVVQRSRIHSSYLKGRATKIKTIGGHFLVDTTRGVLESRRVIIAVSSNELPSVPSWAMELRKQGAYARHVFEPEFSLHGIGSGYVYAVVGSGLTAVQLALTIARQTGGRVYLITKGPIEVNELDFDPCWVGPKCQEPFQRLVSYNERRRVLSMARNKGSIPEGAAIELYAELQKGHLRLVQSRAMGGELSATGAVVLLLEDGERLEVDRVILATGFTASAPGRDWLPEVADCLGLPMHDDGYPIVDSCLRWKERLYVSGALAELEIGAASRNIIGARLCGERIERSLS